MLYFAPSAPEESPPPPPKSVLDIRHDVRAIVSEIRRDVVDIREDILTIREDNHNRNRAVSKAVLRQ
jgi:hypothetical protein